jgi:hypothetical protein
MAKITRVWQGKTKAEHADEYMKYVEDTGIKDYRKVKGNLTAKLWRHIN